MFSLKSSHARSRKPEIVAESRARRPLAEDPVLGEPGTSAMSKAGVTLIGMAVIGFVIWAATAELEETAVASGEVVSDGNVRIVQHLEGGILAEVSVSEGEVVEKDQVIAIFDGAIADSELGQMKARHAALSAKTERLSAFVEGRESDFSNLQHLDPALIADHIRVLDAQHQSLNDRVAVLQKQYRERELELQSVMNQADESRSEIALHREALAMRQDLFDRGLNSRLVVINVERDVARATSELSRHEGRIEVLRESMEAIGKKAAELHSITRERTLSELERTTQELAEIENLIAISLDRVDRLVVHAPVGGIVQNLPQKTERAVIAPGGVVAEIVPISETYYADARISTRDIGFVSPGQPVKVKVQTFDFSLFGTVEGHLQHISPTTFTDDSGEPFYRGKIRLARQTLTRDGKQYRLLPGMTVQADISTGSKTILQYLLKPIYTVRNEALRER